MFIGLVVFIFLLGLSVGSFINVCIFRLPEGKSVILPGSCCPQCGHKLCWWENIPLVSYLFLKGKCLKCQKRISLQYPLIELATGLLFVAVFLKFRLSWLTISALFFISVLIITGVIDLKHQIIPNKVVLPAILVGILLLVPTAFYGWCSIPLVQAGTLPKLLQPLVGLIIGGGFLLAVALIKEGGMGGGDIKLAAFMGIWLGWYVLLALFLGFLIGALIGLVLILLKKKGRKEPISFGPFLALGSIITLFYGPQIFHFYASLWQ